MSEKLLAPPIALNTNTSTNGNDSEDDRDRPSTADDRSLLTVQIPTSPTATSLDGDTLRSRSNSALTHKGQVDETSSEDALAPDNGTEQDFVVESNPFAFSPGQLNKFLNPKSLGAYKAVGGVAGLERGLRTDLVAGLSVDETELQGTVTFEEATSNKLEKDGVEGPNIPTTAAANSASLTPYQSRLRVFKDNRLPKKKPTSIWRLMWQTYNDKILILLTIAAVVSLGLGLYETFGVEPEPGQPTTKLDWVEGVAICVAIIIVVIVGALNDYQKEKQFVRLNMKKEDRQVKAIRSGESILISVYDVTVGDVLHLEPGDLIPVDGIFITGHNVKCDESSATGESDQMRKTPGADVYKHLIEGTASPKLDPFILSGSKVLEGVGTYVVTSVGVNSSFGKTMMALQEPAEPTPLQVKLNGLAEAIAKLGSAAAILLFAVLLFRFLAGLSNDFSSPAVKASKFLDILIVAVTIIVVAVPEGLPLAVTLALAFATTRMLKENNLVRILRACETMGNATTICSDKTGTLTQNKMTVVAGTIGSDASFHRSAQAPAPDSEGKPTEVRPVQETLGDMSAPVRDLLRQSIVINSTAFEGEEDGVRTFIGSKTETALLLFAKEFLGMGPVAEERASAETVQLIPFDSGRKCMGVVIKLPSGRFRLFVKGAAEILLAQSTRILSDVSSDSLAGEAMSESCETALAAMIESYAQKSLRTIAMLYRDFESWPPVGARTLKEDADAVEFEDLSRDMTFLGVVGIQDPLRPGVSEAVRKCQMAGVTVRMVTGDNVTTAHAIASECGIKTKDGLAMEGPVFRQLSEEKMDEILPRLQVLARSSPEDKRILVTRLKFLGETVAVTGDGTNDAPALKAANIGFAMGIAGTEVAKEASSIILMDDNFSSIVTAIKWGRAVNDAVAKFLQFQLTVNITAVLLAFVSAVSSPDMHSVLTAVQLLWVNLIMDTFAALALATDAPTEKILNRKPTPKRAPLITINMWKMIIGQAIFQLVVTFILYFAGAAILGYTGHQRELELKTMVFNTFVWMQIFNEFNNRRLDNKFNIFEGIQRNWFFIGINCVMVGGQIMIIFVGGKAFSIVTIDITQWAICIVCAILCLPWAILLRCIPDSIAEVVFMFFVRLFRTVFIPIGIALSATFRPVKRASRRIFRRSKSDNAADEKISDDEEAQTPTSTQSAPPITITNLG
ncbi:MAG: plasma membrane calcium [Thelocarpon impressellum]|nr:MAG: plasma membrane calcium [Thelocarpon impressellum]